MDNKKEIIPLSQTNDYSDVPSWYVLCTNGLCPFQGSCLRYQVASWAPESMEVGCGMGFRLRTSLRLCDEERLYLYAQRNHQLPAWAKDVL